jgi:membrane protein DedA with SNARE-associated domain
LDWINHIFEQYGYWVLCLGLFTESIAIPFPGELAMAFSGHMVYFGKFNLGLVILCSFLGATIGTTVTYYFGKKLGRPFFEKYGKFIFLNPQRFMKIAAWFEKYGNKLLLISYFIPGFRHFTGYVSGVVGIRLRSFLFFNHLGALLWVVVYVMIGFIFGEQFEQLLHLISMYSVRLALGIIPVLLVVFLFKSYQTTLIKWLRIRFVNVKENKKTLP